MFRIDSIHSLDLPRMGEPGAGNPYPICRVRRDRFALRLGQTEWSEVWKAMMERRQGIAPDCATLWEEERTARHYWDAIQQVGEERVHRTLAGLAVGSKSRVLDIGAGPGTLAIPLARSVLQVTAVEPSMGMMQVLEENIAQRKLTNVPCVRKRWEDVDPDSELDAPFDVVIASFSLEMPDIRTAIQKMVRVCSGSIYLYAPAGVPTWTAHYAALWPEIHGMAYPPSPKFEVLIRVLRQMGIDPQVEFVPTTFPIQFSSMEEALDELSPEFNVRTDRQKTILARYLEGILVPEDDLFVLPHSYLAVKMWWNASLQARFAEVSCRREEGLPKRPAFIHDV